MNPAIAAARGRIDAATASLLRLPDSALEDARIEWHGTERTLRFGLYHLHEVLEETYSELAAAGRWTPAGALAARVSAARWAAHGVLAPYGDLVDAEAGGEWTLRQVLSHVIQAQDFWAWLTGHWVELRTAGEAIPERGFVRDAVPERYRGEQPPEAGTLEELRERLDRHVDSSLAGLLQLVDALDTPVAFQRAAVTIRYYPLRWSAHLREHTLQIEKTVPLTGRRPREVELVLRRVLAAYGEVEGAALQVEAGAAAAILDAAGAGFAGRVEALLQAAGG